MGAKMTTRVWRSPSHSLEVIVSLHAREPPSTTEWLEYVRTCREALVRRPHDVRGLVLSDGGAPSSMQRAALNDALGGRHVPVAVVSESVIVRSIVTALGWFNSDIKSFAPIMFQRALAHLGIPDEADPALWAALDDMEADLPATDVLHSLRQARPSLPR